MSIENAVRERDSLLLQVGKAGLNIAFPNEFEYYLCALELTDQDGKTLKYFVFPVMPSTIDESQPQLNNIKKTAAGITSLSTPTFNPVDITLTGNFGRKFKVLVGNTYQEIVSAFSATNVKDSLLGAAANFFDVRVKTGYGCTKILEDIVNQSNQVDSKGVRRLIFYNPALGNNYIVRAENLKFSQAQGDSNMIWNYNLQLKAIAPLSAFQTKQQQTQQSLRLNTTGLVQRELDRVVNGLTSVIANK